MMVRIVVVLGSLLLGACASHEGPAKPKPVEQRTGPDVPPPEPEPEPEQLARASIASVQMLEDCPEPVAERASPAQPAAKRAAVAADSEFGWSPPCTQSTMQIAFTNRGGPARVAIERITVLHATKSRSLGRIEARSPLHWDDGSYSPWDEVIAPSADTKASYKLSVPDWSAIERELRESSFGQMFVLEVELTIDGQRQTVRSPEFLREEPHVVVT